MQGRIHKAIRRAVPVQTFISPASPDPPDTANPARVRKALRGEGLQSQLHVGPADDIFEREADEVAEAVLRMPDENRMDPGTADQKQEHRQSNGFPAPRPSVLRRKSPPPPGPAEEQPYYSDLREDVRRDLSGRSSAPGAELRKKLLEIVEAIEAADAQGKSRKDLAEIAKAVREFVSAMAGFKPEFRLAEWSQAGFDYTTARYQLVLSPSLAEHIAARLALLGLAGQADEMRVFAKRTGVGRWPLEEQSGYYEVITSTAAESIDLSSEAALTASSDRIFKALALVMQGISKLNLEEAGADLQKMRSIFSSADEGSLGFFSIGLYLEALVVHLKRLHTALQQIFQKRMDDAISEVQTTGTSAALDKAEALLKDIQVQALTDIRGAGKASLFVGALAPEVTRSTFRKKGGTHEEFFGAGKGPRVKIEYYDVRQETGKEKQLTLQRICQIRQDQIKFVREIYGLETREPKAKREGEENKALLAQALGGEKFRLDSIDDWRKFLAAKYDRMVGQQKLSASEAFLRILDLLSRYLKAFTISTPFNIDDYGRNLLTAPLPRALTGQIIHDCGVYALRIVYMLSLISERLRLKIRFVFFPDHVGLILAGDSVPTVIAHNNEITPLPESAQLKSLAAETRTAFFREDYVTLDELKKLWDSKTRDDRIPGPKDYDQFILELAGSYFLSHVTMPGAAKDIPASAYAEAKGEAGIKGALWRQYRALLSRELFSAETKKSSSDIYQLHLQYLKMLEDYKAFHNSILLPFWNVAAHKLWQEYRERLLSPEDPNSAAYRQSAKDYREKLLALAAPVEEAYQRLLSIKKEMGDLLSTHRPSPVASKRIVQGGRSSLLFEYYWRQDLIKHLKNLDQGRDIRPPFSSREGFLIPMD